MTKTACFAIVLLLACATADCAIAGCFDDFSIFSKTGRRCCKNCPNDYCAKPMPCATPLRFCGPNDYCAKPMPCETPKRYCGPDDYCRKPCNIWLPPCDPAWYTCGTGGCCVAK